ncbi:hypothetical protein [Caballeronia sp. S22]|uniref:hypothetical protein n=1 Tax=Caballeronia sp. S22 TaxID=3137182 RepID=UPI003530B2A6
MINLKVKVDTKSIDRNLTDLVRRQIPFAKAQAINAVAERVRAGEQANFKETFRAPSPFTVNSVAVRKATKSNPVATVYVKPIAAKYLLPYETGGVHTLNSRALLNPKNVRLNRYGQLPRGMVAKLKGMPDVFVGAVRTKDGQTINGIWQRPFLRGKDAQLGAGMTVRKRNKLLRGAHPDMPKNANTSGHLKLLVRFGNALPVNKQLKWGRLAKQIVSQHFNAELSKALAKAIATAK